MTKTLTFFVRTAGLMMIALAVTMPAYAQSSQDAATRNASIERVEAKYVCMVNDQHYEGAQIRVPVGKKTYYGCCQGCVATLKGDSESRTATDPVTGKKVDKATAVIGVLPDGTVRYFESAKTLQRFTPEADRDS